MHHTPLYALSAVLLSACSGLPTEPTRSTTPLAAVKLQAPTRNTGTFGDLGAATATNHEDVAGWFVHIVWDYADGTNQIDLANTSQDAAPGQTVNLNVGIERDPCKTYQEDTHWNMPKSPRYTISDTRNYPPIASRMVYPAAHCRLPPSPPIPTPHCVNCEPQPVCSADAFSSIEGHVNGTTIIETLHVKPGFDGILWYLVSYGVPSFRVGNGDLPLPQHGEITTQALHAGLNTVTAPLANASVYAGWQYEGGCERPPIVLTEENLYSWSWLDSGWGNFGGGL